MLRQLAKALIAVPLLAVLSIAIGCAVLLGGISRFGMAESPATDSDRSTSRG